MLNDIFKIKAFSAPLFPKQRDPVMVWKWIANLGTEVLQSVEMGIYQKKPQNPTWDSTS